MPQSTKSINQDVEDDVDCPTDASDLVKTTPYKAECSNPTSQRNKSGSSIFGGTKTPVKKVKVETDRLWRIRCSLIKKESPTPDDVKTLKQLITDTLDLSGRVRVIVRDKDRYEDEDVEEFCKDSNGIQMLFHGIIEIWNKVKDPVRKQHKKGLLPDLFELATDLASLFGEVMSLFLQRFALNILPMLRPVHGLFYAITLHCKYNCLDRDVQLLDGAHSILSSYLSGILGLLRSTKILMKRLKFDDEQAQQRRRMVMNSIVAFICEVSVIISQGINIVTLEEYRQLMYKIGALCTDVFFTVGKTKGITDTLDMGEGVVAFEPPKHLGDISFCDIVRCSMERRPSFLSNITLQDGQRFISDIFITSGSTFHCSEKITLKFPVSQSSLPPSSTVKVKLKCAHKWMDVGAEMLDGQVMFQAKFMQAFLAVAGFRAHHREIPLSGYTYISEEDNRVRINFPKDCFNKPVIVQFRLVRINRNRMFAYKEFCLDSCKAITAISDILFIKFDKDVDIRRPALVHMPIINDIDDPDSEIVMFRQGPNGEVNLTQKFSALRCESTGNCYTFKSDSFHGIAVGKVKKTFLKKHRQTIEEEYRLYTEKEHICCLLTFLDKNLLQLGVVKVLVECVEKRFVKGRLKRRSKEGLFEIPGSRSADLRFVENEEIRFDVDGNIQKISELPPEHYSIVYMSCAKDNYRSFPLEPRKDPRGRHVGILNFFKVIEGCNTFLHTVTIDANRFLVSLGRLQTSYSENRPGTFGRTNWSRGSTRSSVKSVRSTIQYRSIFDDIPVLSHQSLLALAGAISIQVAQMLGIQLGIPYEDILDMKTINQPHVVTIFEILWEWRGKVASHEMVEDLVRSLNAINQKHYADVVNKVSREKRSLRRSDFRF